MLSEPVFYMSGLWNFWLMSGAGYGILGEKADIGNL